MFEESECWVSLDDLDKIEKLKGASNYPTWKREMELFLDMANLWQWIESANKMPVERPADKAAGIPAVTKADVAAWIRAHEKICAMLRIRCTSIPRRKIKDHENAAAAWETLARAYEPRGAAVLNATFRKLDSLTSADCDNKSQVYADHFMNILAEIGKRNGPVVFDEN